MKRQLYIGLMSGTSIDAIDAVLVDFTAKPGQIVATHSAPISTMLKSQLLALCQPSTDEITRMGMLDVQLGALFAAACDALLQQTDYAAADIQAIGSHGQTIRHQPQGTAPFTLQIGDPNIIASRTGITTIADFRRRDMAVGGQGAPLVPAFHHYLLHHPEKNRVIVNIGGIANLTILPAAQNTPISGFDTGPGNILLDAWIQQHLNKPYDDKGAWANSGTVNKTLLQQLLADKFFHQPPPKSTGREHFNLAWLTTQLTTAATPLAPQDVQATLLQFTAQTIMQAIQTYSPKTEEIWICGGGAHNERLMTALQSLSHCPVQSTAVLGIAPQWIEAMAFAWLAQQTLNKRSGNIPTVTGARQPVILGGIYPVSE